MALTRVHSAFFILTIIYLEIIQTKHFLVETEDEGTSDYKEDHCNQDFRNTTLEDRESCCHLPRVTGRCRASFPLWGFDNENATCVEFVYGGCGGNLNAFDSKEDCEKVCSTEPGV